MEEWRYQPDKGGYGNCLGVAIAKVSPRKIDSMIGNGRQNVLLNIPLIDQHGRTMVLGLWNKKVDKFIDKYTAGSIFYLRYAHCQNARGQATIGTTDVTKINVYSSSTNRNIINPTIDTELKQFWENNKTQIREEWDRFNMQGSNGHFSFPLLE